MMEEFIGRKETWKNERTDKQYVADSLIQNPMFDQVSKF